MDALLLVALGALIAVISLDVVLGMVGLAARSVDDEVRMDDDDEPEWFGISAPSTTTVPSTPPPSSEKFPIESLTDRVEARRGNTSKEE